MVLKKSVAIFLLSILCLNSVFAKDFVSARVSLKNEKTFFTNSVYKDNFIVFDGTQYLNKPDFESFGIKSFKVVYESEMWGNKRNYSNLPDKIRIQTAIKKLPSETKFIVINIEHWPLTGVSDSNIDASLSKYHEVTSWFKEYSPDLKVGFYGRPPMPDYWRAINANSKKRKIDWERENDYISSLVGSVDALYPSLYTFYANKSGWVKYAKAQIQEARRLSRGKPVFAFLWPQYHDSNILLGCRFLSGDYWKLQLETVSKLADGAVIWGGWDVCNKKGKALPWDDEAEWWKETKSFLKNRKTIN